MAKREWRTEVVDEEWWATRAAELNPDRASRLATRRHYRNAEKMLEAVSLGIGWDTVSNRWVLPCPNIKGELKFAKAWRVVPPDKPQIPKWVTAGRAHIHGMKGVGLLWDLPWLIERLDTFRQKTLWICAGEWDTIMLRCVPGFAATCWTDGETSAIKADQFVAEFGGDEMAREIISTFSTIAIVFDCDEAGRKGSKLWYNRLTQWLKSVELEIPVVAIDLRKSPGWADGGQQPGWDITDFTLWSRARKATHPKELLGPNWLNACVSHQVDGLLDVESIELGDVLRPADGAGKYNFKTATIDELVEHGVQYAISSGSRGEGAYHLGLRASRNGWDYITLIDAQGAEKYQAAVHAAMPKDDEYSIADILGHFKRSLLDYANPEILDTELANVYRFHHYFPFLMVHPVHGWMWWSGKCWEPAADIVNDHAIMIPGKIAEESAEQFAIGNDKLGLKLAKWAKRSQSTSMINNIVTTAAKLSMFKPNKKLGEEWDMQPSHLATPEGIVDLEHPFAEDGETIAVITGLTARNMFMSQTTNGRLSTRNMKGVVSTRAYVERTMTQWHSDHEIVRTLQELAGWNLFGRNPQKLIVFQSPGRSGKTAYLNAITHSLGALASDIPATALAPNAGDNTRQSALAGLSGKRMTVIKEVGEQGLDPETLKMLTGEDTYSARKLYKDMGTIQNNTTIYCTTNADFVETLRKAGVLGEAMRGRVVAIHWQSTFVDPDQLDLAYRIESGSEVVNSMTHDRAIALVLDHKAGKVFPMDRNIGFSMSSGLLTPDMSFAERAAAPQHMADAWLQWAFDGWVRCLFRGGSYPFEVATSITAENEVAFEAADDVDYYFHTSPDWIPDPEGTIIASAGLRQLLVDFLSQADDGSSPNVTGVASVGDSRPYSHGASTLERLRNDPLVLGKLLAGKRGFTNVGRKTRGTMMFGTGAIQDRCWRVPFKFIG